MKPFFLIFYSALLALTACTTVPPAQQHASIGLPRFMLSTLPEVDEGETGIERQVSIGYVGGISADDRGNTGRSGNLLGALDLRLGQKSELLLIPYLGTTTSKDSNLGGMAAFRYRVASGGRARHWLQFGYLYTAQHEEDDEQVCGIFTCVSTGRKSTADIKADDFSLAYFMELQLSDSDSIYLNPTFYVTHISSETTYLDTVTSSGSVSRGNGAFIIMYEKNASRFSVDVGGGITVYQKKTQGTGQVVLKMDLE